MQLWCIVALRAEGRARGRVHAIPYAPIARAQARAAFKTKFTGGRP